MPQFWVLQLLDMLLLSSIMLLLLSILHVENIYSRGHSWWSECDYRLKRTFINAGLRQGVPSSRQTFVEVDLCRGGPLLRQIFVKADLHQGKPLSTYFLWRTLSTVTHLSNFCTKNSQKWVNSQTQYWILLVAIRIRRTLVYLNTLVL
jgi:hypothetical protein